MMQEWRNINSAPKDGTRVHLGFRHFPNFDVIAHFENGAWRLSGCSKLHGRPEPTHWMPLPKTPQ